MRAGEKRSLNKLIRKRQPEFLPPIMRKEQLKEIIATGKIEGKREGGRPRLNYLTSLSKWMQAQVPVKEQESFTMKKVLITCKDRDLWKIHGH